MLNIKLPKHQLTRTRITDFCEPIEFNKLEIGAKFKYKWKWYRKTGKSEALRLYNSEEIILEPDLIVRVSIFDQ